MPDALYQAAEQLAPAPPRTNFFDPAAGQSIISRYANTRRAGAGLEALGKATEGFATAQMRAEDQQLQRDAAERNRTIFDRETQDFQEKQDFKAQRGDFLTKIGALDPMADDYQNVVGEIIRGVPEVAMKDDAVQAILAAKNRAWENAQRDKEREAYRRQAYDERDKDYEDRVLVSAAEAGLTPAEITKFKKPDGRYDVLGIAFESGRRQRETTPSRTKPVDVMDQMEKAVAPLLTDTGAFPTGTMWVAQAGTVDSGDKKGQSNMDAAGRAQAEAWDKNRAMSELEAARGYRTPKQFADVMDEFRAKNGLPPLTDLQKQRRMELWKVANGGAKQLDEAGALELLKQAKGDKELARKLARDAGYSF